MKKVRTKDGLDRNRSDDKKHSVDQKLFCSFDKPRVRTNSRASDILRFTFARVAIAVALIGAATSLLLPGLPNLSTLSAQQDARPAGAWLDRPLVNWNKKLGELPAPISPVEREEIQKRCPNLLRQEDSPYEHEIVAAGWLLYGAVQSYGPTRVITAMSGADEVCRPLGHQAFVYVGSTYAGTLSPVAMDSLANGDLSTFRLVNAHSISAEFARYREKDPPCCPTRISYVTYEVSEEDAPLVSPVERITKSQDKESAESPSPEWARLFEVKWKLTEIKGVAVTTHNPNLTFGRGGKIFSGNSGCNQIVGRFEIDGTSLTFSRLVGTRLPCFDSSSQQIEKDFIQALEQTTRFQLQEDVLRFYNSDSLMLVFQPDEGEAVSTPEGAIVKGTISEAGRQRFIRFRNIH